MNVRWFPAQMLFSFLIAFSMLSLAGPSLTKRDPKILKDHYFDRVDFTKSALGFCKTIQLATKNFANLNFSADTNEQASLKKIAEGMTGFKSVPSKSRDFSLPPNVLANFKFELTKGEKKYFFVFQLFKNKGRIFVQHPNYEYEKIAQVFFTKNCNLLEAEYGFFSPDDRLNFRQVIDDSGVLLATFPTKRALKPISEISKLKADEIQKIQDKQLVTVAVMDIGVDYNHPDLIFKLRPNQGKLKILTEIKSKIETQPLKLNIVDRFILSFINPDWYEEAKSRESRLYQTAKDRIEVESVVGKDFENDDNLPYDYASNPSREESLLKDPEDQTFDHGTHVSDIATRYPEIRLLPLRLGLDGTHAGEAVRYAARAQAKVINLSMTSDDPMTWSTLVPQILAHPEILFVVAAGNEARDIDVNPIFPASYTFKNMIVVTSVNSKGVLSDFSNTGFYHVHIAALGSEVYAARPENTHGFLSGTSMATPQVSRAAAKMYFLNPNLRPEDIIQILMATAKPTSSTKGKVASGVMDEKAALAAAEIFRTKK